jgi:hypothetical protein
MNPIVAVLTQSTPVCVRNAQAGKGRQDLQGISHLCVLGDLGVKIPV